MSQGPPKRRPPKLPNVGNGSSAPASGESKGQPPTPPPLPQPSPVPPKTSGSAIAKQAPAASTPPEVPSPPQAETPPSDESVADGNRTQAFLSQASGIVAVERGINAKSRVKLSSIARDLGLSDAEFDSAMQTLQRGEQEPTLTADELAQLRRRQRKFHNYVGETLMALPQGVLTSSMEQMLVAAGVEEQGLSREAAEKEILELAQKLRVRRITAAEAERHIVGLADMAMEKGGRLPDGVRERILLEATRWGLTPDQVHPLLDERVRHARLLERTRDRRRVLLITCAAALAVAVLGTLGIMALGYAFPSNRVPESEVAATDGDNVPSVAPAMVGEDGAATRRMATRLPSPKWWSDDLELSVALTGARIPSYRENLGELRADDEQRRAAGYGKLLANVRREELTNDQHAMLSNLVAAAYALDPADACATSIRDELIAIAGGPSEELSESLQPWEAALWAADTISAALVDEDLPEARGAALATAFDRNFATRLERDSPARLSAQVQSAVAARLYRTLAAGALARPELAIDVHARLLPLIDSQLDAAARDRLQADYLFAVLPTLGVRWVIYEDLLRNTVYSDDPLNVLKMLELCEETEVEGLRNFLATQLALRTGLRTPPRTLADLSTAVRGALGATETVRPLDTKERLTQWRAAAAAALAKEPPSAADTREMLQQMVELARLSALGAALAQGELGGAEFEALWREEAAKLKPPSAAPTRTPTTSPRINTTQLKILERSTEALRGYSRLSKLQRLNHVRAVKSFDSAITDVLPSQGQDIAAYLTAAKPVDEHESVIAAIEGILRWRMVRLGIADQLADARLRDEHLLQLVSQALRRDFAEGDNWREGARVALLEDVARELDAAASLSPGADNVDDQASRALAGFLRSQAKTAGVGSSEMASAVMPGDWLALLVNASRSRLTASSSPAARQLVDGLPQQLEIANYLATSDLSRSAQLQRLLIALSAAELQTEKPSANAEITAIHAEYQDRDSRATHVLEQLLAGQRALLQLWMIRNS